MQELSVFIDESGDFGEVKERPAYYLVTFVFHAQENNIDQQVAKLEESIKLSGFDVEYIHTGPVIRREEVFARYSINERRKLLYKMLNFVNTCPITYLTVVVDRKEAKAKVSLSGKLAKAINKEIDIHQDFFANFDKIIVYYDNGQNELSAILNAVFSIQFSSVEFRKAAPQKYRLLQAADFICAMELLKIKKEIISRNRGRNHALFLTRTAPTLNTLPYSQPLPHLPPDIPHNPQNTPPDRNTSASSSCISPALRQATPEQSPLQARTDYSQSPRPGLPPRTAHMQVYYVHPHSTPQSSRLIYSATPSAAPDAPYESESSPYEMQSIPDSHTPTGTSACYPGP